MSSSFFQQLFTFVTSHWQLFVVFAIITVVLLWCEWVANSKRPPTLTANAMVHELNAGAIPIDIRTENQFIQGHILNSVRLDPSALTDKKWAKYKDKHIVIICQRGQQAQQVATKLIKKNFSEVSVLGGGFTAWKSLNMPISKGKNNA